MEQPITSEEAMIRILGRVLTVRRDIRIHFSSGEPFVEGDYRELGVDVFVGPREWHIRRTIRLTEDIEVESNIRRVLHDLETALAKCGVD